MDEKTIREKYRVKDNELTFEEFKMNWWYNIIWNDINFNSNGSIFDYEKYIEGRYSKKQKWSTVLKYMKIIDKQII